MSSNEATSSQKKAIKQSNNENTIKANNVETSSNLETILRNSVSNRNSQKKRNLRELADTAIDKSGSDFFENFIFTLKIPLNTT